MSAPVIGNLERHSSSPKSNACLVADFGYEFVRRLRPDAVKEFRRRGKISTKGYAVLRRSLHDWLRLFDSQIKRMINKNIGRLQGGHKNRRNAPVMHLGRFINPQNRGIGPTILDRRLNPGDRLRIYQVVASIHSVNVRCEDDFVARFKLSAIIQKVIYGDSGPSWYSYCLYNLVPPLLLRLSMTRWFNSYCTNLSRQ